MDARFGSMGSRFESVEARFDACFDTVDLRLHRLETDVDDLKRHLLPGVVASP